MAKPKPDEFWNDTRKELSEVRKELDSKIDTKVSNSVLGILVSLFIVVVGGICTMFFYQNNDMNIKCVLASR